MASRFDQWDVDAQGPSRQPTSTGPSLSAIRSSLPLNAYGRVQAARSPDAVAAALARWDAVLCDGADAGVSVVAYRRARGASGGVSM